MWIFIGILAVLQAALVPAQLITLKDGKVGVNFAGYHADAGLGGLLTGNSAHGGLSASAGTPWGARSAAGLGGDLNGAPSGLAYAAAQSSPSVGASAVLSGEVGKHGYAGSEAHVPGKVASRHHSVQAVTSAPHSGEVPYPHPHPVSSSEKQPTQTNYVQKIKPPKKYSLIKPEPVPHADAKVVHTRKSHVQYGSPHGAPIATQANGNPVGLALDIPIGILRSLQQSIGALVAGQPAVQQPYQG